ncbi:MAG: GIY-YIG nuclease family protein [Gemmatimonadetes bacterium]|nr:GIY-YIG nuclease family protein [Gemmatimonadota bacterium]
MPAVALPSAEAERLALLRAHVRGNAEDRPGVYRMITETGEVAYVGKSKRVRTRLMSYFRAEYPKEKAARIVREAEAIEWEYQPSEFAALREELRLIKAFRPRLNVAQKRDARHLAFVRITPGRAPRLAVVRGPGAGERGGTYYGPFNGAGHLREALRELSTALGLRDCTLDGKMRFADQVELLDVPLRTPGCLRYEIGTCLGPCVGAPTARAYNQQLREARAFLEGATEGPIVRLDVAMQAASAEWQFERAAVLRDKKAKLESLQERFSRLRFAVESLSFVYLVPGHAGEDRIYLVRRGVVRAEHAAPDTPEAWAALASSIHAVFRGGPLPGAIPSHEVDELLLLTSWFSTRAEELDATVPPASFLAGHDAR